MKIIKLVICLLSAGILSSCLDSEEKIVINSDNSGTYTMTLDLGKVLEMAASMGAKTDSDKVAQKKDTTIYLKGYLDSASNLTAEEKALFREGVLTMKLDEVENEMKIVVSCPFKKIEDLTAIKNNFFNVIQKVKAFEKATGEKSKEDSESPDMKMGMKSTNPIADQFKFLASPGKISNTIIDLQAYKNKIATDSTLTMMSQMTAMMGDFKYRTIFVLPKAVKKYDGPGSTISTDKKNLTFETTLTEMMEQPEKVSYVVEY
jgi:hypothetical protein